METIQILNGLDEAIRLLGQKKLELVCGADAPYRQVDRARQYLDALHAEIYRSYFQTAACHNTGIDLQVAVQ